jgi:hypothetical protein
MFQNKNLTALESNLLFKNVDESIVNSIFNSKNFRAEKEGGLIFQVGDESKSVFLILQGKVKLKNFGTKGSDGTFRRVKNEFFGEKEVLQQTIRISSAVADTDCIFYLINKDELFQLIAKNKTVLNNVSSDSSIEIKYPESKEEENLIDKQNGTETINTQSEKQENETQEEIIIDQEIPDVVPDIPDNKELYDSLDESYFSFSKEEEKINDLNFNNGFEPEENFYKEKPLENILDAPVQNNGQTDAVDDPKDLFQEKENLSENELISSINDFENIPMEPEKFAFSDNNTFSSSDISPNTSYQTETLALLEGAQKFLSNNLRFPVEEINKYASFLKENSVTSEGVQVSDLIIKQTYSVISMVESALEVITGKNDLNLSRQNVEEAMNDILFLISEYADTRNVKLYKKIESERFFDVDKERLYSAFFQVAKNACDAMRDGGNLFVTVSNDNNNNIKIEFMDEGLGIPSSLTFEIFEPLITHGKPDGAGFGLSVAKKIIQDHNGTITVDGELGEGTKIIISLPGS